LTQFPKVMEADKIPTTMAPQAADEQVDVVNRAVAFPDDNIREEKIRPKGVELKRNLTQEEKDLSAAGYEHLDANAKQRKLEEPNLDIQDHKLPLDALSETFTTSFDSKDPGHSIGLTAAEAKSRLELDGPNILTPPKKKSSLRKVKSQITCQVFYRGSLLIPAVFRTSVYHVQYIVDGCRCIGICFIGY